MLMCLWFWSHDSLSVFCLQHEPYHSAQTCRNGSHHQQLSTPFSLSASLLKTVLAGGHSLLLSSAPFVQSTASPLVTCHFITFLPVFNVLAVFPHFTELPTRDSLFFPLFFLILCYSFLLRQEDS